MTNPIIKNIRNRLLKWDQNWISVITGQTGSGKSVSAVQIANLIDPTFYENMEKRIIFEPRQFLDLLDTKIPKGSAIVWDEVGVGLSNRDWQNAVNKAIGSALQTFRYRNLAVIFTLPNFGFLDKQARELVHAYIETEKILKYEKVCRVKWQEVNTNSKTGDIYTPYLRRSHVLETESGEYKNSGKVFRVFIKKPPTKVLNRYVRLKHDFNEKLLIQLQDKIAPKKVETPEEKAERSQKELEYYIGLVAKEKSKYLNSKGTFDSDIIRASFGISTRKARAVSKMMNNGEYCGI